MYNREAVAAEAARKAMEIMKENFLSTHKWPERKDKAGYYNTAVPIPPEYLKSASDKPYKNFRAKTMEELQARALAFFLNPREQLQEAPKRHTLAEAFEAVLEQKRIPAADPGATASGANTVRWYVNRWRRFFIDYAPGAALADRYLDTITPDELMTFASKAVADRQLKDSALTALLRCLSVAFDMAVRKAWIPADKKSPYELANFKDAKKRAIPKPSNAQKTFTDEDYAVIDAALKRRIEANPNAMTPLAYIIQEDMGLRRGEAVCLKWEDIDGSNILIRRVVVEDESAGGSEFIREDRTKTDKIRLDGLSDRCLAALECVKAIHERLGLHSEFLFPDPSSPTGCFHIDRISRLHQAIVEESREAYEAAKAAGVPEDQLPHYIKTDVNKGTHAHRRFKAQALVEEYGIEFAAGALGHTPDTDHDFYNPGYSGEFTTKAFNKTSRKGAYVPTVPGMVAQN